MQKNSSLLSPSSQTESFPNSVPGNFPQDKGSCQLLRDGIPVVGKKRALRTSCYTHENGVKKNKMEVAPESEKVRGGLRLCGDNLGLQVALRQ